MHWNTTTGMKSTLNSHSWRAHHFSGIERTVHKLIIPQRTRRAVKSRSTPFSLSFSILSIRPFHNLSITFTTSASSLFSPAEPAAGPPRASRACIEPGFRTGRFALCDTGAMRPPIRSCDLLAASALALLQLSAAVQGATPPPPSNTTAGAFANFSEATEAASFLGANNLTYIGCEGFDDARAADRACVRLLGHTRGTCYASPVYGNATSVDVCRCITYAGLTPPGNCVDATCVWGADACSVRQWQNYVGIVLHSFAVLQTTYVFGFGLYVIAAGRKNLRMNSMSVTLVCITLASMFHLLWRVSEFVGYGVLLSTVPGKEVQKPIAVPGFTMCGLIGVLAFPLQWLEVAKKAAQIKVTRGRDSSRCKAPHVAVAITAFVITGAVLFFAITGRFFLISSEFPSSHMPVMDV